MRYARRASGNAILCRRTGSTPPRLALTRSGSTAVAATRFGLILLCIETVVGRDDIADEAMANHILLAEAAELDVLDSGENDLSFFESRRFAGGQIDLCHVAGNDG